MSVSSVRHCVNVRGQQPPHPSVQEGKLRLRKRRAGLAGCKMIALCQVWGTEETDRAMGRSVPSLRLGGAHVWTEVMISDLGISQAGEKY